MPLTTKAQSTVDRKMRVGLSELAETSTQRRSSGISGILATPRAVKGQRQASQQSVRSETGSNAQGHRMDLAYRLPEEFFTDRFLARRILPSDADAIFAG